MPVAATSGDDVVAAGELWCRLVSESDVSRLQEMTSEDFTCRRADGTTEEKAAWLAGVESNPRQAELSEPSVWRFGSVAVLTFYQRQALTCSFTHLQDHGVAMEPGVASPEQLTMLVGLESLQVWTVSGDRLTLASHEEWLAYG
jgi:hypothetical protein